MYDIIIVGAGTAGLSAAIYGVRAGKRVLVIEGKNYGGQIVNTPEVENYPGIYNISGFEFATNLYNQATDLGAEVIFAEVTGIEDVKASEKRNETGDCIKIACTSEGNYRCKSVILATGAKNRPLGVEREAELVGAGVSYCATCDGMFFRGKDVAVVGGGNTALEDAHFLSNYCNKVYVIHRRNEFRGEEKLSQRLHEKENVELVLSSTVTELLGEDMLEAVVVENVDTKERKKIAVSGLFIAIGQMPDNEKFADLIDIDSKGYIVATEDCMTSHEGIFVAGDCRTKQVRQLTTAAADGAVAALAACEYVELLD